MPDPIALRNAVLASDIKSETGPDGKIYRGISRYEETAVYERIALALARKIRPMLSFYRLDLAGEFPHSVIHADDTYAYYAALLFLNLPEQCQGGTAFWQHIPSGAVEMPKDQQILDIGLDLGLFKKEMAADWNDASQWVPHGNIAMVFNRCVIYPACRFHSRVPAEAFGTGPQDGRLVGVTFFDIVQDEPNAPAS